MLMMLFVNILGDKLNVVHKILLELQKLGPHLLAQDSLLDRALFDVVVGMTIYELILGLVPLSAVIGVISVLVFLLLAVFLVVLFVIFIC